MPTLNKKTNFIKQAGILAFAGILCRIIGILYRSPLTQIIGDEGNGYYSSAYNIYTIILLVSSYSIPSAISKEISQKLYLKEYKNAQRIFRCALIYVLIVGGAASLLTFFCAGFLVEKNSAMVLRVFAPTILFSGFLGVFRGYFQAHRTMTQTSISQILEQILNAVISISAAYLLMQTVADKSTTTKAIYGAAGSAIGTGAGVIIALLFMLLVYLYNKNIILKRLRQDSGSKTASYKSLTRRIILTVTPIILSTFIYNLSTSLNQTIYTKISMYWKGIEETKVAASYGIFAGKAVVISNIPIAIASAMSAAMLPTIAGTFIQGNLKETNRKIEMATRTTMMISIPAAVGLAVLARPVVQLLFPQKGSLLLAASLLRCMSITVVFYSLSTLTNAVLQGIGKVNLPVVNALISLILQTAVLLSLLFCTGWDLYGLAAATVIYSLIMCILNGYAIKKHLNYKQNIKMTFLIPFATAAVMGIVAALSYMGTYSICKSNIISLFVSILIAGAVYFILIIKLGAVSENELICLPKGKMLVRVMRTLRLL
jgi:Membrane protein involved in the export of O-antigen and teichoic acid